MKSLLILCAIIACSLAAKITSVPIKPLIKTRLNRTPKITGGQEVYPHSLPYQVALYLGGAFCGATLISPRWVLTTAACADYSKRPQVILGAHRIDFPEDTQKIYVGKKIILHEEWNGEPIVNDIALIELPEDAPINDYIKPIDIAPSDAGSYAGEIAVASGWGQISDLSDDKISYFLYQTSAKILTNADCQAQFLNNVAIYDTIICMDGTLGNSICEGDGGGPLVVNNTLVGVLSFSYAYSCEKGFPSGCTRVSSYRDWIDEKMKE